MERDKTGQWNGFTDRGQSVFDFSIGVSLFLVVVIGVLVFIPTAFTSFTSDAGGDIGDGLAADKAADYLAESTLAGDSIPSVFDSDCTILFFARTMDRSDVGVTPENFGFEQGVGLANNASLNVRQVSVNVTIERWKPNDPGRQRLCWTQMQDFRTNVWSRLMIPIATRLPPMMSGSLRGPAPRTARTTLSLNGTAILPRWGYILSFGRGSVPSERGQTFTLEAVLAALIVIAGLLFALQAVTVTASTTGSNAALAKAAQINSALTESADRNAIKRAVLAWDSGFQGASSGETTS